jgi:hypothetical protein
MKIGDLVKKDFTGESKWFDWTSQDYPAFKFQVELMPVTTKTFTEITAKHTKKVFNRKTRQFMEETDNAAAGNDVLVKSVKDWRGLTVELLRSITPLVATEEAKDAVIPFSTENLKELADVLPEFGAWVIETAMRLKNFDEEDELKNS